MSFKEIYNRRIEELHSEERRFDRRVEALLLVERNYSLQELIADINEADTRMIRIIFAYIADYINKEYDGNETADSIWELIFKNVYEDKEEGYELWRNGITNSVRSVRNGTHWPTNSITDIYRIAAFFTNNDEGDLEDGERG